MHNKVINHLLQFLNRSFTSYLFPKLLNIFTILSNILFILISTWNVLHIILFYSLFIIHMINNTTINIIIINHIIVILLLILICLTSQFIWFFNYFSILFTYIYIFLFLFFIYVRSIMTILILFTFFLFSFIFIHIYWVDFDIIIKPINCFLVHDLAEYSILFQILIFGFPIFLLIINLVRKLSIFLKISR